MRAMGSDLNPVAVLIGKALVELPPKFAGRRPVNPEADELRHWKGAEGLAEDVRYYGRWLRDEAEKRIGPLYPKAKLKDGKEAPVIAWVWARTVPSPDPRANGAQVPLASSFVLSTKPDNEAIIKPVIDRARMEWRFETDDKPSAVDFEQAKKGTKTARGANFICLLTGAAIDDVHVKREAKAGRMGAALMAIVAAGTRGRLYLSPTPEHVAAAQVDAPEVPEVDQPLPNDPRAIWCTLYGLDRFTKLFTPRQLVALTTFSDLISEAREKVLKDAHDYWSGAQGDDALPLAEGGLGPAAYADAVATYLALSVDKAADYWSTVCFWHSGAAHLKIVNTFARHAIPMTWDYAEGNPFSLSSGHYCRFVSLISEVLDVAVPALGGGRIDALYAPENHYNKNQCD